MGNENHSLSMKNFFSGDFPYLSASTAKIIRSKSSSGHQECSFDKFRPLFLSSFANSVLLFSVSNFSFQLIDIPPDFFSVVGIWSKRHSDNKLPVSNISTARLFSRCFVFSMNFYAEMSCFNTEFYFSFLKTSLKNFYRIKLFLALFLSTVA